MSSAPSGWQAALADCVSQPDLPAPPDLRLPADSDGRTRLAVYRNNVLVPLVQSLEESFPACRQLLGGPSFRSILIRFVRAHPPAGPVLLTYGQQLPGYLALTRAGRDRPAALDLARLELMVVEAWHAADAPLLAPDDLLPLLADPDVLPGLSFELHPAARLIQSEYAIGSLWLAHHAGSSLAAIRPMVSETVLVTRSEWEVQVAVLSPQAASLLTALICGANLGEALQMVEAEHPGTALDSLLAALITCGAISTVRPA